MFVWKDYARLSSARHSMGIDDGEENKDGEEEAYAPEELTMLHIGGCEFLQATKQWWLPIKPQPKQKTTQTEFVSQENIDFAKNLATFGCDYEPM